MPYPLLRPLLLCWLLATAGALTATSVVASSFGYDPADATTALRNAILSEADTVIVDRQATDWIVGSLHLFGVNDKTIVFEDGVVVRAKSGAFADPNACLFRFFDSENLSLIGYGAELTMNQAEYVALNDESEYRHALSLWSCRNVRVSGLRLSNSGGDGIYIGGESSPGIDAPCRNVRIDNVDCDGNYRQGMSVANVVGLHVRNSRFRNTAGTLPEAGVDLEPYQNDQFMRDIRFTDCSFTGNGWAGIAVAMEFIDGTSPEVDVTFTDCYLSGNRRPENTYGFTEIFIANNGDSPVGGQVTFERVFVDGSDWTAFYGRTAPGGFATTFTDCTFRDVSRLQIDFNNPIWLEQAPQSTQPRNATGPLVFNNLTLSYATDFAAIRAFELDTVRDLSLDWRRFSPSDDAYRWDNSVLTDVILTDEYAAAPSPATVTVAADTLVASECNQSAAVVSTTVAARPYALPVRRAWGGAATPRADYDYRPPGFLVPPGQSNVSDTLYARADGLAEGRESLTLLLLPSPFTDFTAERQLALHLADCADAEPLPTDVYPFGPVFARGLYSLEEEYETVAAGGWTTGHSYAAAPALPSFFGTCARAGLSAFARLSAADSLGQRWPRHPDTTRAEIVAQAANDNLAWWDLPEELRYWVAEEMAIVRDYAAATRAHDPKQRPTYMYLPGHYPAENIEPYVPFLDILPASCYPVWQDAPNAYVRWSIERTRAAIAGAGYTEGADYRNGEKTVMAILELFEGDTAPDPTGSVHDYWLAVALDVRGLLVFSHFYRDESPTLAAAWDSLSVANALFTGERIDAYLLGGTTVATPVTVTSGPDLGPEIMVDGGGPFRYASLTTLGKQLDDTLFVAVVNSATEPVGFALDLPESGAFVVEELRTGARSQVQGTVTGQLGGLGVRLYKVYRPAGFFRARHDEERDLLLVGEEPFLPVGFYAEGMTFDEFPDIPERLAAGGFNTVYTESPVDDSLAYDDFLRRCDALGLKNILGTPYAFAGQAADFERYVNRFIDYPSVISWNLLDDANNFDEATIAFQDSLLRTYDRSRLRSASWYATGPLGRMLPYVDLAGMQAYPWRNGNADLAASHAVLRELADTARLVGTYSFGTPQAFNWDDSDYPPAAHVDVQAYQSLAAGTRGLLFYTFKDYDANSTIDVTQPAVWTAASRVAGEVLGSELKDAILFGDFEATWINFYRNYGTWDYGDAYYYVVVNTSGAETFAYDIPLPADAGTTAENLFADRPDSLRVATGRLVGNLGPYQPAIYRIAKRSTATTEPQERSAAVFPNPTDGRFWFSDPTVAGAGRVVDAAGRAVRRFTLLPGLPVDTRGLPAGAYVVEVRESSGRVVRARVVLR